MSIKKQLPVGTSSFQKYFENNYLYIDKTEIIHDLITSGTCYFLARPRRFGKSLLVSTLKEIFLGNKEVFKDCWIDGEGRYDFKQYPVVHIDFSELDYSNVDSLSSSLEVVVHRLALMYGVDVPSTIPVISLFCLVVKILAEQSRVVILIDEYDAPIIKNIDNLALAHEQQKFLSNFYTSIKALDPYIHFLFLTGVSKFSKTSVFSGLNNLKDISFNPRFSAICGYTQEEIQDYLTPYVHDFALVRNCKEQEIFDEMRTWYNGYRFSYGEIKVYNPFSVFNYLQDQRCQNYWFASGTPTFLINLVRKNFKTFSDVNHSVVDNTMLDAFEIDKLPLVTLLYQTGYLTIEEILPSGDLYRLTYPNEEVRRSFNSSLMSDVLNIDHSVARMAADTMRIALQQRDISLFCTTLQSLFAHIPYNLHIKKEAYYHSLLQMAGGVLGFDMQSEVATSNGSIDVVLSTATTLFVFELKLDKTPESALEQIKERRYYEKYQISGKVVILVGMSFIFKGKKLSYVSQVL